MSEEKSGSISAVFALILGIIGIVAWIIPIIGVPIALLAIILGITGRDSKDRGLAIAGIVLGSFSLILALSNSFAGAYLGFTGQLFPNAGNSSNVVYVTATPRPSTRIPATATEDTRETGWRGIPIEETIPPAWANCQDASAVGMNDVGDTKCVRGEVVSSYWDSNQNAFFVHFSKDSGEFYILSYGGGWNNVTSGTCVYATHEITQLGPSPVMVLDPADPLYICD